MLSRDPNKPLTGQEVEESFEPTAEERKRADELLEDLYSPVIEAMKRRGFVREPEEPSC